MAQKGIKREDPDWYAATVVNYILGGGSFASRLMEEVREKVAGGPVYLSMDIDGLDPAFAPGTGTPVVGGLSSALALQILYGLAGMNFVGMDIAELAPAYDVGDVTALAGATIAHNFLSLLAAVPSAD